MLNFPVPRLPEQSRVYRQKPEIVARYAYHLQFKCKIQRNWQILKAQTACCVDSTMLLLTLFLERNAQSRGAKVTRTDSGLPPDARNSSEIRVSHTIEVQFSTKLANSERSDRLLRRFHHAERCARFRGVTVTRTDSGLPPDARTRITYNLTATDNEFGRF